jgi:hypothetical protein
MVRRNNMDKIQTLLELDKLDIVEEFINCMSWLSKHINDFTNESALDKSYSIWEKNMALRHWLRKNTLKNQYQLWIGKKIRASEKIPTKGSVVVFTKEKNAYTWSSSKRFASANSQSDNDKVKGGYLIRVYVTKDEVMFDLYGLSKLSINDDDVVKLIDGGVSEKKAKKIKEILDELAKNSFKEVVICTDVVNRGVVSALSVKNEEPVGNWRIR